MGGSVVVHQETAVSQDHLTAALSWELLEHPVMDSLLLFFGRHGRASVEIEGKRRWFPRDECSPVARVAHQVGLSLQLP